MQTSQITIKALFFDVFGTLVDWRSSVAREAEKILRPQGKNLDWLAFADAWRGEYQPGMEEVRSGRIPFAKLDVLHRRNLERFLPRFIGKNLGVTDLPDAVLAELTLAWHRLDAWPDVPAALARLKTKFMIAPCSNGNISLMVDLARRNNFPWDAILGAEIAGDFKPKPGVYLSACAALDLPPAQCMMVAAHSKDLAAAAAVGLRTAHTARPDEYGPNTGEPGPIVPVDYAAKNLAELADSWASDARSRLVNGLRLAEEARQDVVDHHVILLLEAGVRNAGHHGELLVRVRQLLEELQQILHRGDAVELAAHDQRRHRDLFRVHHRQPRAHVDIGAGRHRIVERDHGLRRKPRSPCARRLSG